MTDKLTKRNLPTIQQLREEASIEAMQKDNLLNVLLNHEPDPAWLKEHPMVRGLMYIPIGRIEWLLTRIFVNWHVEIKSIQLIGNSVVAIIRLHYQNITDDEWSYTDGVGASPLQTDKDAGAIDFNKLKSSAVMLAAPAAESYAVKDAAEKLGKLFGKDISRKDQIGYESLANSFQDKEPDVLLAMKKIIESLDKYTGADKDAIRRQCIERQKSNTFTVDFAKEIGAKIGVSI